MKTQSITVVAAITTAAALSSGCMSMMIAGAPTTQSFDPPPVRETVDSFPRESLIGKWTSTGKEDMFMDGKRILVSDVRIDMDLNEDGTCTHTETKTITENRVGAQYGRGSQEAQIASEGTWSYQDGILSMDLHTEVSRGLIKRTVQFQLVETVKWHSDEEFSLYSNEEQFAANSRSMGSGLGWDSRTVEPNGVETYVKKGGLMMPDQKAIVFLLPFKRVGDAE